MARVKKRISIVLVDDNSSPREAMVDRLAAARGLRVLTVPAELKALPVAIRETRPDIVLLNLARKGKGRLTFAAALHGAAPELPVIIMGLAPRRENVMSLVRTGVAGFIMANAPLEVLPEHHSAGRSWDAGPAARPHPRVVCSAPRSACSLLIQSIERWVCPGQTGSLPA